MAPPFTHAAMRLGRELRYRPLPIIGKRVVIETLDHVEHVLRQLATPWITRASAWDGCDISRGLAKYGLLDRWCTVDAAHAEGGMRGIPALRDNGFGVSPARTRHLGCFVLEQRPGKLERVDEPVQLPIEREQRSPWC